MIYKTLTMVILGCLFLGVNSVYGQTKGSSLLVRSTCSNVGGSMQISVDGNNFVVQQSIGQSSITGTNVGYNYILRQGFIQPITFPTLQNENNNSTFLELNTTVFPNPFKNQITIEFNEMPEDEVVVKMVNASGELVFINSFGRNKSITFNPNIVASGFYIISVVSNKNRFIRSLIKK